MLINNFNVIFSKMLIYYKLLLCIVLITNMQLLIAQVKHQRADIEIKEEKKQSRQQITKNQLNKSVLMMRETEKKLIEGINATLKFYYRQLQKQPKGSANRLTIMMRILNLHLEQASYVRNEEERKYDEAWTRWASSGRRGAEPKLNISQSTRHWKSVIRQADVILFEFPKNPQSDRVLFTKAFAYQYSGKEKEAAKMYTKLIQKYPNSSIAGEAYASLGDFYFDRNDFRNAIHNYNYAIKYKKSERYLWSIFKLGWCYYNLGQYAKAIKNWKKVVILGRNDEKQGMKLREEALRDMVYAFAELKDIQGAISYYKINGGSEYIGPLILLFANRLIENGEYDDVVKVLKLYQKMFPYDIKAPETQMEIISLMHDLGKYNLLWKELKIFRSLYNPQSEWAKRNQKDQKIVLETHKNLKDKILYYSKILHKKGQEQDNKDFYLAAKEGYIIFLQIYPDAPEIVEVKYNLADIEHYFKNYRNAGRLYAEIATLDKAKAVIINPNTKKTKNIHKESSLYMIEAFARDFESEFKVLQKTKPDFTKPVKPLSQKAKNYIKACTIYAANYPKDQKIMKTCQTDIAYIYYYSNDKENSKKYLGVVALQYPGSQAGINAIETLIPLYKNDEKKLTEVVNNLLKIPAYQKGKIGKKLQSLKHGIEKESIGKEKDAIKRATRYEALAKKYPNDPEADILWYNAGVEYLKGGAISSAIVSYLTLINKYPKSKQAPVVLLEVAKIYEKRLDLNNASKYFLLYAQKYSQTPYTKGALIKACDLAIASENTNVLKFCQPLFTRFTNDSVSSMEKLILLFERQKKYNQMYSLISDIYLSKYKLSFNQKIIANYKIYKAFNAKDATKASKAVRNILNIFHQAGTKNIKGEALRYVGEIKFKQADVIMKKYVSAKLIGGTVDALQSSIENKAKLLEKLLSGYDNVIKTTDSYWGVAALYQKGFGYEILAQDLANPPAIKDVDIKDVVAKLKPRANEALNMSKVLYNSALNTVRKFKVYNEWSVKVINALHRVKKESLSFDDWVVMPDFVGGFVSGSLLSEL